ncbi:hypothetical protein [Flagellimonas halotolerans]|uniref:Uncharacterized protein n=1 Tax=Flagellimonas halotolerans TaxID=3112164 RepID=A0ABU6IR03_9FLAO|nr:MULTISPECIES: hypothetical protein [unclassified Allomuricauda]MEC3965590.1 hypothetical protein [Muricauda sp. SYSU M86414]MEC4265456.1 hypothetical protein [Muricauda sp. SYSU M84420]
MSKKKQHIDPSKIHIKHIEELFSEIDELDSSNDNKKIEIKVAHNSAYDVSQNGFLLGLQIVFESHEENNISECKFRYNFYFEVDNLSEMYSLNEDDFPVFQKLFVATLSGISYSTLRGIIMEKTSNTPWGTLILPVIDPSKILESWISQE